MNIHIQRLLQPKVIIPTATGVVGFAAGAIVCYWRTRPQYNAIVGQLEMLEAENERVAEFMHPQLDFEGAELEARIETKVEEIVINRLNAIAEYSPETHPSNFIYSKKVVSHEHETPMIFEPISDLGEKRSAVRRAEADPSAIIERGKGVVSNIFDNGDTDEWDYKSEIEARDKAAPYVIHVDEFVADEMDFGPGTTLTWYEKDQILCDSHDKPIYNHGDVVGELRFGHGSNDANVVYIRNERLQAEYEVLRDEGSYEEIVLGETLDKETQIDELRHSAVRKFRED